MTPMLGFRTSALALRTSILALTIATAAPAFALDVIASAKPGGTVADIDMVVRLAKGEEVRPVFSPDERQMLAGAGRGVLADAKKFSISSERALIDLNSTIQKRKIRVHVEPAEIEFQLDGPQPLQLKSETESPSRGGASFEKLQWAIKNFGQKVAIAIDDMTSLFVDGKPGEDIGLEGAPKELADPKHRITIAVLDTGIDFGHPELLGRVVENMPECRAIAELTKCRKEAEKLEDKGQAKLQKDACDVKYLGKDFDGNGYPLDCSGWNVTGRSLTADRVWGDADASDKLGHGTHVAGTFAARSDDRDGIRGIIDNVQVLPVKVISAAPNAPVRPKEVTPTTSRIDLTGVPSPVERSATTEKGLGDLVARGMLYAIRSGAQIINMSLGWPVDVDSNLMQQMIDLARSRGILLVAAAGNDGTDALIRPCVFNGVICVASHDPDGAISHFSNYGAGVDIAAPGLNILSLFPTALNSRVFTDRIGYELKNGTSMASPFVAGLLGRLLNRGISAQEAQARLMVGARPVAANPRVKRAHPLLVQSGNADLARAFAAIPQPLIVPTAKRPVSVAWDRHAARVPLKLEFDNIWTDAKSVTIELRPMGMTARDLRIESDVVRIENWNSGETQSLDLELAILSNRLESDFTIELKVTAVDAASNRTTIDRRYVAVTILTTPRANDPELRTLRISGDAKLIDELPLANLRTVSSLDGKNEQDYVTIREAEGSIFLALLAQDASGYRFRGTAQFPEIKDSILMVLQRIDLDGDGSSDYAIVWKTKPTAAKRTPTFIFRFFDSEFKPLVQTFNGQQAAEVVFDNSVSVIEGNFQWISDGQRKIPAWITRGTTPELEKKPYDPWNPTPRDLPDFRLYAWSEKGLITVRLDKQFPVTFVPATHEEQISGQRRVIWMSGEGTESKFELRTLQNLKLSEATPLDLGGYRRVRSTMIAPILTLAPTGATGAGKALGMGIYSDSFRSALRVTGLLPGSGPDQSLLFDKILTPESTVDSVTSAVAGFKGSQRTTVIAQTIYEMQYEDLRSGKVASATLRRFSFMPEFFFEKFYRPVLGENSQDGAERLPMVYLAQGLGTGASLEVLAPRYENGKLQSFLRPARLQLVPPVGCESMGDTIAADSLNPTRVVFVCPDRVIQIPLRY